ncbi:hypothetical protein IFM89_035845 [Coptis chinensis]|uniref:PdxS/SNZ N-terminal domain-containing protein n=1 Tax=Coptis chinensis TaxID=261450 RepID=A0A835LU43_9MAGN|nr:hypothetical protein IFM89_035845 [Coptis chinensis]
MAKARVWHFIEAQILEVIGVEYIDEIKVLACSDEENYINKHKFRVPFVSGCRELGEALSRVRERAVLIRIQVLNYMDDDELFAFAKRISTSYDLVAQTKQMGRLPVVLFAAGGIATLADVALMMQLGYDGVFLGSEVFEGSDPFKRTCSSYSSCCDALQ